MRARAAAAVEAPGDRLVNLRSAAPLLLRPTPEGLFLVGGAAGPLGGDDLELSLDVGPDASLTLRTSAASVVLPGREPSMLTVRARVAAGGTLRWLPEPSVAAAGCVHHMRTLVELSPGAQLVWREEVVLGREGEPGGTWESDLTVDLGAAPLLRHGLRLGPGHPGWDGPAVLAGAKAVGSLLVVPGDGGAAAVVAAKAAPGWAVLLLAGPGYLVTAVAQDALELRKRLCVSGTPAGPGAGQGVRCPSDGRGQTGGRQRKKGPFQQR